MKNDSYQGDTIALASEALDGEPLLSCVMRNGTRLAPSADLKEIRKHAAQSLRRLPPKVRALRNPAPYPVEMSRRLTELWKSLRSDRDEPAFIKQKQG